ncbi:hypothetical protein AAG570_005647 [Ranatra chinensis]|uniref:Uncharacterized protein n=1 Tax=Ranatra chinensis TaxID=642074 RepID=A0ABD0XY20_9HEMI
MGGLFYAGQLTEVTPPDLYGVTLDKERGHRPHILCREQILTDAILEIRCDNLSLDSGTRLCAYWSQQYRCLYPGTVCSNTSADDKFVWVEFDDGDNGKINRDDIRLLPYDYPIVGFFSEYDPNPLLSLGKRKRHNSTNSCDSQVKITEV